MSRTGGPGGVTVLSDPRLNGRLDRAREIYFRHSGRKGDRKSVAEALLAEKLAELEAAGWFDDPDRVEGLLDEGAKPQAAGTLSYRFPGVG